MSMRPLTKVVLVLALAVMAIGALFIASRDWSDLAKYKSLGPTSIKRLSGKQTEYSDPVAMYERWRKRLTQGDTGDSSDPKPKPVAPPPEDRDLLSSSRDEGTIVGGGGTDAAVAGADPPGPVLRPGGIVGDIITGPLRPKATAPEDVHIVAQGDTLYSISVERYGSARFVDAIVAANPGIDPGMLRVGDRIVLPKPGSDKPAAPKPKRTKVYVVKKGDTLIGIARKVYGDAAMYPRIYEANKDVLSSLNARLYVGMRLRLPDPP